MSSTKLKQIIVRILGDVGMHDVDSKSDAIITILSQM